MPSWHLGTKIQSEIRDRVAAIMKTRLEYARDNAPFTPDDFQPLTVSDSQLVALRELELDGMEGLPRTGDVPIRFLRKLYPGLKRGAAIRFVFSPGIYGATRWLDSDPSSERMFESTSVKRGFLATPERLPLSQEQIDWINRYTLEVRCGQLVHTTVNLILSKTQTSAELLADFQFLTTIVEDKTWRARFQGPVKITSRHRMSAQELAKDLLGKRAAATNTLLTGGLLLGKHDDATPRAMTPKMIQIEKLPSDVEF